ncbi:MAG: NUDIX hydrolase [Chloroflexi bacterium]|nr:NUDIX hydrolase [Chloroflexota bacterium]
MPPPDRYYVTVDAVTVAPSLDGGRSVLLIRRGHEPFAGSWALPGGFVDPDEDVEQAARRELLEETGVSAPAMHQIGAFGDPDRDPRGRAISVAFLAVFESAPAALAGDDAADARWFPIDRLPKKLAFDHAAILAAGISLLKEGRKPG